MGSKRKLHDDDIDADAWTVEKCRRLLQPLHSAIQTLRNDEEAKEVDCVRRPQGQKHDARGAIVLDEEPHGDSSSTPEVATRDLIPSGDEPDWLPIGSGRRKCVRKNYARRNARFVLVSGRRCGPLADATDEVSGQTCRMGTGSTARPHCGSHLIAVGNSNLQKTQQALADMILSFKHLLQATVSPHAPAPIHGAPSLLDTALCKLAGNATDPPRSRAVRYGPVEVGSKNDVYSALQDLGTLENKGWHGLRQFTQAVGSSLIVNAIRNHLVPRQIVEDLCEFAVHARATAVVRDILRAEVFAENSVSKGMMRLCSRGKHRKQTTVMSQVINGIVVAGALPMFDVDFYGMFLTHLAYDMLKLDVHASTLQTFEKCVLSLLDPHVHFDSAKSGMAAEVVGEAAYLIISAAVSSRCDGARCPREITSAVSSIHRIATMVCIARESPSSMPQARSRAQAAALPWLIGSLVLQLLDFGIDESLKLVDVDTLAEAVPCCHDVKACASIVERILEDSSSRPTDDNISMTIVLDKFIEVSNASSSRAANYVFWRQLALDTAVRYDDRHACEASHALVKSFLARIDDGADVQISEDLNMPCPPQIKTYRWDDTISGWIAATVRDRSTVKQKGKDLDDGQEPSTISNAPTLNRHRCQESRANLATGSEVAVEPGPAHNCMSDDSGPDELTTDTRPPKNVCIGRRTARRGKPASKLFVRRQTTKNHRIAQMQRTDSSEDELVL